MPRVNLTEEEASLIEARRAKHAVKLMRNATLDEAKTVVDQVISRLQNNVGMLADTGGPLSAAHLIVLIKEELDKRREKI